MKEALLRHFEDVSEPDRFVTVLGLCLVNGDQ